MARIQEELESICSQGSVATDNLANLVQTLLANVTKALHILDAACNFL